MLPTCRCFSIPEGILHGSSTPSNHQASAKDLQEPWPDKHLKPCDKFSLFSPRMLLGVIRDCRPINIGVIGLITISKTHSTFYILHTYKHINKYRKNYIYIYILHIMVICGYVENYKVESIVASPSPFSVLPLRRRFFAVRSAATR